MHVLLAAYITKGQRGMSELLRKACNDVRKGHQTIPQQLRTIGNRFLNTVELSAQEAAYILLQLPMKKASRSVYFINTNLPEDRVFLVKSQTILDNMHDDDTNIAESSIINRYEKRPAALENVTLAEYVAWYTEKKHNVDHSRKQPKSTATSLLPEQFDEDNVEDLLPLNEDNSATTNSEDKLPPQLLNESSTLSKRQVQHHTLNLLNDYYVLS